MYKIPGPAPKKTASGGDLLSVQDIAERAEVSESYIKRLIQNDFIAPIRIGGRRFMYYRDFLRAVWAYEQVKERPGRKPANANWED